jgi:hypothetical protein
VAKLADPAAPLRPTARRILLLLRDGRDVGPQRVDQLAARLTAAGRRPIRPATVAAALGELQAADLAAVDDHAQGELTGRWAALPVAADPCWMRSICTALTTSGTPTRPGWRTPASRPG